MGADGSHNSNVPPPFLTKTYEMVDDPATDDIVSWSDNNSSFVVWNVADFTKDLLPQYFKHNNFSSFVRQLNTYGFHKIDPDRQEFANEGFSKGNKEGLKNIHRRKPTASHTHSSHLQKDLLLVGCCDPAHAELEEEIKILKQDKGLLVNELVKVKQLQETTETELDTLGQRLQGLEERQQKIMTFLAQAMHHPSFAQFVQQTESLAFNKKRRLPEQEGLTGIGDSWCDDMGQLVRYHSADTGDLMSNAHLAKSEGVSGSESSYERVLKQLAGSTLNQSDETSPLSRTSGGSLWELRATSAEHVDSAGNSEALECSDWRGSGDLNAWRGSSVLRINGGGNEVDHDEQKPVIAQEKDGFEVKKVNGSNDVFWESMLTENPRLPDRDSEDCRSDGHANERWFL